MPDKKTKTIEPPTRKQPEQLPADDGGGTEGGEPEQSGKVDDDELKSQKKPAEKDKESRSDENSGCGC